MLHFLKKILPDGLIVIARPATKGFVQVVCGTFEAAVAQAQKFDAQGKDCYFGLGSLHQREVVSLDSKGKEKKEIRVGSNIAALKCLFLDLDVGADDPKKHPSQQDAILAVKQFCKDTGFPAPMLVNSGGGIHAYWPFDKPVAADQWRVLAQTFKDCIAAHGLKTDPTITADASRILRVVGTHSYKGGLKRPVELIKDVAPYDRVEILKAVAALAKQYGITPATAKKSVTESVLGGNLKPEYPPSEFALIVQQCPTMAGIVATGGPGGVLWAHGLAVALQTTTPDEACLAVSEAYLDFDIQGMHTRVQRLKDKTIGPTICTTFQADEGNNCKDCKFKGTITSPIQLGVAKPVLPEAVSTVNGAPAEVVWIGRYPFPYVAADDGAVELLPFKDESEQASAESMLNDSKSKGKTVTIYDYRVRPYRRMHCERREAETTHWQFLQPNTGWVDVMVEQSLLSRPDAVHGLLLSKGVYVAPGKVKHMVNFMVLYISKMQKEIAAEQVFARLGWRDDFKKFVLDDFVYHADGAAVAHAASNAIKAEIPGLGKKGDLENWKAAIQFYNASGHEAHRFMLYCGFGSPLLHMTGHKGGIINAMGKPGAGKTTTLLAVNSMFGHPVDMMFNANKSGSTTNAWYGAVAAYNNIAFCADEITRIDPKVFGEFALAVPQGVGKRRMLRNGELSPYLPTWANMTLTSANVDAYVILEQSRGDAAAEAVRVLQIPFEIPPAYSKAQADKFIRDLKNNYGHAGHAYIQYVTQNYELIKSRVEKMVELIDSQACITSAERFWSAFIASSIIGAFIARKLGLLTGFPVEHDFDFMIKQVGASRANIAEHIATPVDTIAEFLEARVGETLVLSQTLKANIAPRIDQVPRGALCIRHEVDTQRMYVMKSEFKRHCAETGANFGAIQDDLELRGVLIDRNKQIVLGKGTDFGKGQVRCWELDMRRLEK